MIHRKAVQVGIEFTAPCNCTFGFQAQRAGVSVWYKADDKEQNKYIVLGTGHEFPPGKWELVSSCCLDGYHMFHLLRKTQ